MPICDELAATRPTAVNLFWAIDRMKRKLAALGSESVSSIKAALLRESQAYSTKISPCVKQWVAMVPTSFRGAKPSSLTAMPAPWPAGYGTALGVIRAVGTGKKIEVIADETRPVLQGARLTAWELMQDNIPVTLITDNMAGSLMRQGKIHLCVVGADRIAANGDVANKIGTYSVAVLAKAHGIPFYVAAPYSTIDLNTKSGADIPIEQRNASEVTPFTVVNLAPTGVKVYNPAFDVTPAELISGIITERGVFKPQDLAQRFG